MKYFTEPLYHWHFELSSKCSLRCPRCPRTEFPSNPNLGKELDLEFIKKVLSQERLVNEVKRIDFCGDIGDSIYAKDFLKICRYIKEANPKIHLYTITNGSYKTPVWWKEFASISNEYDTINFSVDGYDQLSNDMYRVNSNFDSIMAGMKIMGNESSSIVNWAMIVFKFNQDHLDDIKQLATDNGCDGIQVTKSTKFGSNYQAYNMANDPTGTPVDPLEPDDDNISQTDRYVRTYIPLSDRMILGPGLNNTDYMTLNTKLYHKIKNKYNTFITPMCLIGNRGIFINAVGTLFPCSWVSFPFEQLGTERKTIDYKDSFFVKYADQVNLFKRSFEEVIDDDVWDHLFGNLNNPNKAWVECENKCHKSLVDFKYAVGYETN